MLPQENCGKSWMIKQTDREPENAGLVAQIFSDIPHRESARGNHLPHISAAFVFYEREIRAGL